MTTASPATGPAVPLNVSEAVLYRHFFWIAEVDGQNQDVTAKDAAAKAAVLLQSFMASLQAGQAVTAPAPGDRNKPYETQRLWPAGPVDWTATSAGGEWFAEIVRHHDVVGLAIARLQPDAAGPTPFGALLRAANAKAVNDDAFLGELLIVGGRVKNQADARDAAAAVLGPGCIVTELPVTDPTAAAGSKLWLVHTDRMPLPDEPSRAALFYSDDPGAERNSSQWFNDYFPAVARLIFKIRRQNELFAHISQTKLKPQEEKLDLHFARGVMVDADPDDLEKRYSDFSGDFREFNKDLALAERLMRNAEINSGNISRLNAPLRGTGGLALGWFDQVEQAARFVVQQQLAEMTHHRSRAEQGHTDLQGLEIRNGIVRERTIRRETDRLSRLGFYFTTFGLVLALAELVDVELGKELLKLAGCADPDAFLIFIARLLIVGGLGSLFFLFVPGLIRSAADHLNRPKKP